MARMVILRSKDAASSREAMFQRGICRIKPNQEGLAHRSANPNIGFDQDGDSHEPSRRVASGGRKIARGTQAAERRNTATYVFAAIRRIAATHGMTAAHVVAGTCRPTTTHATAISAFCGFAATHAIVVVHGIDPIRGIAIAQAASATQSVDTTHAYGRSTSCGAARNRGIAVTHGIAATRMIAPQAMQPMGPPHHKEPPRRM